MNRVEVPYLIVGAGPVGMMCALLLAKLGKHSLVIERRSGPQTAPAAHVVNARTLEICRQAGVDMHAVDRIAKSPADAGHTIWLTRLNGEEVGRLPFERQGDECLQYTPTPLRNISQHRFEPILASTLDSLKETSLRFSQQWESAVQDADGVTSVVRDLASGETREVRSRFLIAADGAGSRIRKSLDIEMDGPPRLQSFMMIHFGANLREIVRERPGVLYWIMDPEAGGAFVAHDIDHEWVYMHGFDPDEESDDDYDDDRCRALVLRAIGEDAPMEVLHRGSWHMSAQVAQAMRRERIFLAGDAAHRFPPTGGLGLNTGVQDVHGLAWRLAAVEDGWASEAILDDYERERLPVARNNSEQSLRNALKMIEVPVALGVVESATTEQMTSTLADSAGRAAVVEAIANQAEHFDMLGLQLGYCYGDGGVVPDGSPEPEPVNPVREYTPSARPGARLPHAWLESDGRQISSLDLVQESGFTLFTWQDHDAWSEAVGKVSKSDGVPLTHVRLGEAVRESSHGFAQLCGIERGGAVLVRPDQHVAWRVQCLPEDAVSALRSALLALLAEDR